MAFNYYLPVNLVFGKGRTAECGRMAAAYGKKALVVTGKSSTKRSGLLEHVMEYLKDAGVDSAVFDKVSSNPLTTTAEEGAKFAKEENCDVIIGLGGGSIMDCAKAIAFLCVNNGDINDYIYNRIVGEKALPLILIPTTCGTGSEGNGFAVLTNPENGDKKSLRSNAIIAKVSIIDSELMRTMPKHILSSVGFDALCHSMESYLSNAGQPMTDMISLEAMNLIGKYLVELYSGSEDDDAWDAVTWASTLGGMAINTAGVTLPHGMEHPASGLKDIVHGRGLAALTPIITEASALKVSEKYAVISKSLGGKNEKDCADTIYRLLEKIDLVTSLGQQGITDEDIPWMVENCFKVSAAGIANHPVLFDKAGVEELYRKAI